jgi:hypothetical protein
MLSAAALVALPSTSILIEAIRRRSLFEDELLFAAAWHGCVWGVPAAVVIARWRHNILHGRPASETLLKTYWFSQFLALIVLPFLNLALALLTRLRR